jgi:ABC-2 type transport system ATP-binding protein
MRTKLGFVLAAMHDPELLVLDEPTTGVDPVSRVELWRMISEAVARGTAVVMTTTYLDEAERTAAVTLLDRGAVLLSGPPGELIGAMPGAVAVTDSPTDRARAWRIGPVFHEWFPPGAAAAGGTVEPTLDDACIVAQIAARERVPGGAP